MIWKIPVLLFLACLSAWLYRAGGQGAPYNTRYRDAGCPAVFLVAFCLFFGIHLNFWWAYLLTYGLSWGFMTTYWDFCFKDENGWNFWLHGLMLGLAALPLMVFVPWWVILLRACGMGLAMGAWSACIGNDVLEERGRGFIYII